MGVVICVEELKREVIQRIDVTREVSDEEVKEIIDNIILEYGNSKYLSVSKKCSLQREIYDSIRGLDILEDLLKDNQITEIMINGPDNIFVEKNGEIERYNGKFKTRERLMNIIQQIVSSVNRRVNESSPIADSRLKDGSRVNVVLSPIALDGPAVTIRKFPKERITMDKLIEIDAVTKEVADFLKILVIAGYNIFISGGTGSGKTTFLNVLSNYIPQDERIITIEDSAELQLQNSNLVRLECRQENDDGENGITIRDLIKSSLRMRPDRIIVGEIRGAEAIDMLQAMNTGHDGSLSTGHANSPMDMLSRIETMVLTGGVEIPINAIKGQIASGIEIIVHLGRLRDRTRKVLEIVEILGIEENEIQMNSLYTYIENKNSVSEKVIGKLEWTGNGLINVHKLLSAGFFEEAKKYGKRN